MKNITEKKQKRRIACLLVILAVLIILALIGGCHCLKGDNSPETPFRFVTDTDASEGGWEETDRDAVIDSLNQKVEEGMMNISINTTPVFENGNSKGNLMIVNETVNRYPQIVEIVLNSTGETIYTSKGIPVGNKIEYATLDICLSRGIHECTAYFHAVDPETGEFLGTAGAVINITVKN